MKKLSLLLILAISIQSNAQEQIRATHQLKNADQEEWISLFNGKDLTGWDIKIADFNLNDNYKETFVVQDSMIRIRYNCHT